jgi:hypothetical protein
MAIATTDEIRFEPAAFDLANRFDQGASRLMARSIEHARRRSGNVVSPQDVKAAMQDLLAEIQTLFENASSGKIAEIEVSDEEFRRLGQLSFRRPDVAENADDDL